MSAQRTALNTCFLIASYSLHRLHNLGVDHMAGATLPCAAGWLNHSAALIVARNEGTLWERSIISPKHQLGLQATGLIWNIWVKKLGSIMLFIYHWFLNKMNEVYVSFSLHVPVLSSESTYVVLHYLFGYIPQINLI